MAIISISEAAQQWQVDQAILYQKIKNGDLIMSARSDGTHGIDTSEMVKEFGVAPTKSKKSVLSHEQDLHGKRPIKISPIPPIPDNVTSDSIYAGFWKRLVAYFLDSIILTVFFKAISIPIGLDPRKVATIALISIGSILITWLYYSLMESSTKQGTLGKMALGIKVVDIEGNQISFWRATGRHFSKIVSSLLFGIGYLMIAFTEKKQALHDKMADCLVVNKNVSPVQLIQDGTATRLSNGAIAGLILLSLVIFVGGILAAIIGIMYAQDYVESFKKTENPFNVASEQLEKELGKKPSISWEIKNTITEVNVVFRSGELTNVTVGETESKVRSAVLSNFKQQPNQINLIFILSVKQEEQK